MHVQGKYGHLTQFQNAEKWYFFMNVSYTKAVDRGAMCSAPGRIHIILRNPNINFHISLHAVGWWGNRMFGSISLMILLISTLSWTCYQSGVYRNWTAWVLKTFSKRRAVYQHVMHSLLGNTLLRFSGNVWMVVSHQCCLFTRQATSTPRPGSVW
jgi:hypothetical protein